MQKDIVSIDNILYSSTNNVYRLQLIIRNLVRYMHKIFLHVWHIRKFTYKLLIKNYIQAPQTFALTRILENK